MSLHPWSGTHIALARPAAHSPAAPSFGLPNQGYSAQFAGPAAEKQALDDRVLQALRHPLGYPPLRETVFLGDHVTLAIAPETPQGGELAVAVAQELISAGCRPDDLCILLPPGEEFLLADVRRKLSRHDVGDVECAVHDPAARGELAFLARTGDQLPIVLNRHLVEADVVISIGCLRHVGAAGYDGPGGDISAYSDDALRRRFRDLHATENPLRHAGRAKEKADEVLWLLGSRFTVQVVADASGDAGRVLAGDFEAVLAAGRELLESGWNFSPPRRADLVLVTVEGGQGQQSWQNAARALAAAGEVVAEGGAIALLTRLNTSPGEGLSLLRDSAEAADSLANIRRNHPADALAAMQFARSLEQSHVFLFSELDDAVVEDLGIAPLANEGELARLVRRHDDCILIRAAQFAQFDPA